MYKLKYYSLAKEEKVKIKEEFYQTEFGSKMKTRLNRLLVTGILSFIFSIYLFISHTNNWEIITGITLLCASFVFVIASFKIRIRKINDFLVKKKKQK